MKKAVWGLAAALSLASCGGGESGGSTPPPPAPPPPPATVAIEITQQPRNGVLYYTDAQHFACAVTGSANTACTWEIQEGLAGGVISPAGLYVAPPVQGTFHIVATAAADASKTAVATVTVRAGPPQLGAPWSTGYYSAFHHADYPPQTVDMAAMTHIVFDHVAVGSGTGGGNPGDVIEVAAQAHAPGGAPDGGSIQDYLIGRAHLNRTKAILMLGSGDYADDRAFLRSASDANRPRFVANILNYMAAHDYDGVDLHWVEVEGSIADGADEIEARRRMKALIADLRRAAESYDRYRDGGIAITVPAPPVNAFAAGGVEPWRADIARSVDQYNIMAHGRAMTASGGGRLSWFVAPIGGAEATHPYDLVSTINAYVLAGVDQSRLGIGVGFYGVYYGPSVTAPRQATETNTVFETRRDVTRYRELRRLGYLGNGAYRWDEAARAPYRAYGMGGYVPALVPAMPAAGYLTYEDEISISVKARMVNDIGLGGMAFVTINDAFLPDAGTNPLLTAARRSLLWRP